ncbi:hypothetical protein [Polaribacter sp. Z022]|uniref:hypothetical protein n=1 Tax=Polaribacter sp. Z022 TaxID=2927125 RepID=UPI0020213366|nr:hypothetical protein [Polaribacter sp. Z022]MCL7755107.1 hypothetical protein [Polaribacter sp. Z022]
MDKIKTLIFLLFVSTSLLAQEVEIPNNLKLENKEDYKKTEQLVLNSTEWLLKTPISENPIKRKDINAFLMKWMSGSPTVSIELVSGIVPLECADCLMSFMSGWTKYSLENNYSKNKVDCALAGAENAIEFYEKNKSELGKNSDMEKLIKRNKKGKLKKYIESKF